MEHDDETESHSDQVFCPDDWVSSADAIRQVRTATLSPLSHRAIAKRAHAGMLRSWAELLEVDAEQFREMEIPRGFWWAEGEAALIQNWEVGDFSTWLNRQRHLKAFGVLFHRGDLARMLRGSVSTRPLNASPAEAKTKGGRSMSSLWPEWVAELVALVHEEGLPTGIGTGGADDLTARVADRLAARDLEAPARTTVQETIKAVLRRLREAGN